MGTVATEFDPKAHFESRNAAEQARREGRLPPPAATASAVEVPKGAEVASPPSAPPEHEKPPEHRASRSDRRLQNRLREEIGELRGRLKAYEEMGIKPKAAAEAAPSAGDDPEPKITDFQTEAEYYRALGRWDARQEVKKVETKISEKDAQAAELEQLRSDVDAAEQKAQTDIKELFPDWDEVSKAAAEDEDAPEFVPAEHPMLMMLIARSDVKARVLYYFAKNPDELERILDLTKDSNRQIAAFHRLEGKLERVYDKPKAAQASETKEPSEDRTHPAEGDKPGRTAASSAELDARKPRPSTEVAARGGSAPPEEPAIGSAAWMARRNQAERQS
jgi:hypothetical protein